MTIKLLLLCLVCLCAAGCASPVYLAEVVRTDDITMQVQNIAPTIPLLLPSGTTTTLAQAAAPFYVVAFVDAPAGQFGYIDPRVAKIAKQFSIESVSTVQITTPAVGQHFPTDALQQCTVPKSNLILVLDPKRLAWQMFRMPTAGTLLLIDRFGYITQTGNLSDPKAFLFRTYQMAQQWQQKQFDESFLVDDREY